MDKIKLDAIRAMAVEYRGRADDLEAAADLLENGYQTDQVKIDTEIQKVKDEKDARIATLEKTLTDNNIAFSVANVEEVTPE